jgi:hypothetical protein
VHLLSGLAGRIHPGALHRHGRSNYLDTRFVGEIIVQGNHDFSLDGLPNVGTTTTKVAVSLRNRRTCSPSQST